MLASSTGQLFGNSGIFLGAVSFQPARCW